MILTKLLECCRKHNLEVSFRYEPYDDSIIITFRDVQRCLKYNYKTPARNILCASQSPNSEILLDEIINEALYHFNNMTESGAC